MATSKKEKKPAATNPNPDWQDRDIQLRPIVASLVLIAVVCAATAVGMFALFGRYHAVAEARDADVPAMVTVRELPPAPNLQVNGRFELNEYKAKQDALLHHYDYTDKVRGTGRIPIARAMQLLAVDAPDAPMEAEAAPEPPASGHH
jgi:hypothetical protein